MSNIRYKTYSTQVPAHPKAAEASSRLTYIVAKSFWPFFLKEKSRKRL
jgi:hypothetical protein